MANKNLASEKYVDEAVRIAVGAETKRAQKAEEANATAIAAKQDKLTTEQIGAINSGITAQCVSDIDVIVGKDAGKSARDIASEEVAKVVANAPQDLDTLKEIADYIASDKTGAAQMASKIDANAKAISDEVARALKAEETLGEDIDKKVNATKTEVDERLAGKADKATTLSGYGITDAATKAELDALSAKLDAANAALEEVA